ncbi:sulfur carrier protein [Planomicrobium sp. HSC-17F08]|nr:sulfur carrier protein [Planomicrobium sp. HSC-17F08]
MKLTINGELLEIPDTVETVSGLLEHFQLDKKVVIVERNADILEKSEHTGTQISDGDKIELVHFVGGG